MYINLKNLLKEEVGLLPLLECARQMSNEDLSETLSQLAGDLHLDELVERGMLKLIKGKKSDSDLQKLRLGAKGKKWLYSLSEPTVSEGDLKMFTYLKDMYLSSDDEDRKIGNQKKTLLYVAKFRAMTNLSLHEMFYLCEFFLDEYKFTKVLQYIFHNDNKDRYGTFNEKTLEDSPLYQFLNERKKDVEELWKIKID
jgi:hypothetical protein